MRLPGEFFDSDPENYQGHAILTGETSCSDGCLPNKFILNLPYLNMDLFLHH